MRNHSPSLGYPDLFLVRTEIASVRWIELPNELRGSEVVLESFRRMDRVEESRNVFS